MKTTRAYLAALLLVIAVTLLCGCDEDSGGEAFFVPDSAIQSVDLYGDPPTIDLYGDSFIQLDPTRSSVDSVDGGYEIEVW